MKVTTHNMWTLLCKREDLEASQEKQTEKEEDILHYCRKWDPMDEIEFGNRLFFHPVKDVCDELWELILLYHLELKKKGLFNLMEFIVCIWKRIKDYEKKHHCFHFVSFQDAVACLGLDLLKQDAACLLD